MTDRVYLPMCTWCVVRTDVLYGRSLYASEQFSGMFQHVSVTCVLSTCKLVCIDMSVCLLSCQCVSCHVNVSPVMSVCLLSCQCVSCHVSVSPVMSMCLLSCQCVCVCYSLWYCTQSHKSIHIEYKCEVQSISSDCGTAVEATSLPVTGGVGDVCTNSACHTQWSCMVGHGRMHML